MKCNHANSTSLQPVRRSLKAEDHTVRELQLLNAAAGRSHGEKSEGKQNTHFKACAAAACVAVMAIKVKGNAAALGGQ